MPSPLIRSASCGGADGDLGGNHLICVVSEQVPEDYLAMLREKGISYIVSGKSSVDLANAVNQPRRALRNPHSTARRRRPH